MADFLILVAGVAIGGVLGTVAVIWCGKHGIGRGTSDPCRGLWLAWKEAKRNG